MTLDEFFQTPDPQPLAVKKYRQALEGEIVDYEDTIAERCWKIHIEPQRAVSGKISGTIALLLDVTERKNVDEALAREHNLLRTVVDNLPVSIYAKDRQGRKTFANPLDVRYCGCTSDAELLGKRDDELFPPEMATHFIADDRAVLEEGQVILNREEVGANLEGKPVWLSTSKLPLRDVNGNISGLIGIGYDITERKQSDNSLRESEARFKAVSENSHNAICLINETGKIVWINESFVKLGGYSQEHILAATFFIEFLAPESIEFVVSNFTKFVKKEAYEHHYSFYFVRADGQKRLCEKHMTDYEDQFGKRILAISMVDVTERQRSEEARRLSEEKYSNAFHISPDSVNINRLRDGLYVEINEGFTALTGYTTEDVIGKTSLELDIWVNPQDRNHLVQGLQDRGELRNLEAPFRTKNGQIKTCLISASIIKVNGETCILSITRDITERKNLEKSLVENEKLAGIGTLAAGIAHEINTPLQIITGVADSLLRELGQNQEAKPEDLERRLQNVGRNGWRIAAIVRSLLDYARSSPGQVESASLNDIVRHTLLLIEHQLKSWDNITITTELDEALPPVMCDPNKLTQVVLNLLTNARDAMPDGGWITMRSSFDEKTQLATLRVEDSGSGVPDEIRDKIFDPFFTTKPIGEGTGLGLSISIGILRAMGGTLELENTSKQGSVFKLCLPLTHTPPVEEPLGRF